MVREPEKVVIRVVDYDPMWPVRFANQRARIEGALAGGAIAIEHIGSTSVPGLAAKAIIDILLVVEDSSDEAAYLPALEAEGYELRIREPEWHDHRMVRTPERDVHIHVFSAGSPEIDRHLAFRDWLRGHPDDCALYAVTKRSLAEQDWPTMQDYADAKTAVIERIMSRGGAPSST